MIIGAEVVEPLEKGGGYGGCMIKTTNYLFKQSNFISILFRVNSTGILILSYGSDPFLIQENGSGSFTSSA